MKESFRYVVAVFLLYTAIASLATALKTERPKPRWAITSLFILAIASAAAAAFTYNEVAHTNWPRWPRAATSFTGGWLRAFVVGLLIPLLLSGHLSNEVEEKK